MRAVRLTVQQPCVRSEQESLRYAPVGTWRVVVKSPLKRRRKPPFPHGFTEAPKSPAPSYPGAVKRKVGMRTRMPSVCLFQ